MRWVRCLPLTSFRFRVTTDTLVSLARRFPLLGLVRDLHPLDNTHASQTKKEAPLSRDTSSIKQPSVIDSTATNEFITNKPVTASSQISFPLQNIYITSPYGYRNDPFTAKRKFHNGIDLRANYEPCYAILDGIVERIGNDKRSGNFITLRHGNYTISYCHLSHILVPQGIPVQAGTPIAITGSTGCSTAPHLHLSIKYKRKSIDAKVLLDYIVHSKDSKFWCQGVNQ